MLFNNKAWCSLFKAPQYWKFCQVVQNLVLNDIITGSRTLLSLFTFSHSCIWRNWMDCNGEYAANWDCSQEVKSSEILLWDALFSASKSTLRFAACSFHLSNVDVLSSPLHSTGSREYCMKFSVMSLLEWEYHAMLKSIFNKNRYQWNFCQEFFFMKYLLFLV